MVERRVAAVVAACLLLAASLPAEEQQRAWRTVPVGKVGGIEVRLRLLSPATLADEEWIALEFENRGQKPVRVVNARYRMESRRHGLATGKPLTSGGLASGNAYDLFSEAWETTPVTIVLLRGTHRVVEHPSRYSSTLLGLPPKAGLVQVP